MSDSNIDLEQLKNKGGTGQLSHKIDLSVNKL